MIKKIAITTLAFFSFTNLSNAEEVSNSSHCFKYIKGIGNKSSYDFPKEKCLRPVKQEIKPITNQVVQETQPIQEPLSQENTTIKEEAQTKQENSILPVQEVVPEVKEEQNHKNESSKKIKTEGHYVGLSAIGARMNFHERYSDDLNPNGGAEIKPSTFSNGSGVALEYKYAFNFNDYFIAPVTFFEKYDLSDYGTKKAYSPETYGLVRLDIKDRYGFGINAGYDVNNTFSPYLLAGMSFIDYTAKNGLNFVTRETAIRNATKSGFVFGAGFKINLNDNFSLNFEGNTQKFAFRTNMNTINNIFLYNSKYIGRLNTAKIGLFYNF